MKVGFEKKRLKGTPGWLNQLKKYYGGVLRKKITLPLAAFT